MEPEWKTYEKAAETILGQVREHFGLAEVEGKQSVPGASGTAWEIDAKGINENGIGFVIIEARRHTNRRLEQEDIAGLAFRIEDTGATGGIVVTPVGLQEGARKLADATNIKLVRLSADATPQKFAMEFLGNVMIRLAPLPAVKSSVGIVTVDITNNIPSDPNSPPAGIDTDCESARVFSGWTQAQQGPSGFDPEGTLRIFPPYSTDLATSQQLIADLRSAHFEVDVTPTSPFAARVAADKDAKPVECSGDTPMLAVARAVIAHYRQRPR